MRFQPFYRPMSLKFPNKRLSSKLDEWSTDGIFKHQPSTIPFTLLGISGQVIHLEQVRTIEQVVVPREFNKVVRAVIEHKMLDTMISFIGSGGNSTSQKLVCPNTVALSKLRSEPRVRAVRGGELKRTRR